MSYRTYPKRDRALRQVWRRQAHRPAPEPLMVTFTADSGPLLEAVQGVQASLMFGWHPDLRGLDDALDILYPGAAE